MIRSGNRIISNHKRSENKSSTVARRSNANQRPKPFELVLHLTAGLCLGLVAGLLAIVTVLEGLGRSGGASPQLLLFLTIAVFLTPVTIYLSRFYGVSRTWLAALAVSVAASWALAMLYNGFWGM